ncbi:hypothetical protein IAT38_006359 [Cryptococcus sp. DSM 104549]
MSTAVVSQLTKIKAKQLAFQAEAGKAPVYLRGHGKYYYRAYVGLLSVSIAGSTFQLIQYIRGKAGKKGE